MAGWIKMRASLMQSSKLVAVAAKLQENREFVDWMLPGGPDQIQLVSHVALKCIACSVLLRVWSAAREFGLFEGDDLMLPNITVHGLDGLADVPGIGEAMELVGWAIDDEEWGGVRLPNFKQHNVPMSPDEKATPLSAAERSKRCRERKRNETVTPNPENVTKRDANVTDSHANVTKSNGSDTAEQSRAEQNIQSSVLSDQKSDSGQRRANGFEGHRRPSVFDSMTPETITDARQLRAWFDTRGKAKSRVLPNTPEAWELCCGAAIQSRDADVPIAMFKSLVTSGKDKVTDANKRAGRAWAKGVAA